MYAPVALTLQGKISNHGLQGGVNVTREELLDALLLLYQECSSPDLMKIEYVANFVNKCKHLICIYPLLLKRFSSKGYHFIPLLCLIGMGILHVLTDGVLACKTNLCIYL